MNIIAISYDLSRKNSSHYQRIIRYIRCNYECLAHQKSMWLVRTDESVDDVQRCLSMFIDSKDKLAVFEANQGDVERFSALA